MRIRVTTRADLFEERKQQHIERGYRIEDERPTPVNGLCSFIAVSESSRKRWQALCGRPSLFIVGRERAKLGYFCRHAYCVPRSGPYLGCVVNSDTGQPVIVDENRLTVAEFDKFKIAETIETRGEKSCRSATMHCRDQRIRRV